MMNLFPKMEKSLQVWTLKVIKILLMPTETTKEPKSEILFIINLNMGY